MALAQLKGPQTAYDFDLALKNIDEEILSRKRELETLIEGRQAIEQQGVQILELSNLIRVYGRPTPIAATSAAMDALPEGASTLDRIAAIVTSATKPLRPKAVAAILLHKAPTSVESTRVNQDLAALTNAGRVARVGHGLYWKLEGSATGKATVAKVRANGAATTHISARTEEGKRILMDAIRKALVSHGGAMATADILASIEAQGFTIEGKHPDSTIVRTIRGEMKDVRAKGRNNRRTYVLKG